MQWKRRVCLWKVCVQSGEDNLYFLLFISLAIELTLIPFTLCVYELTEHVAPSWFKSSHILQARVE